MPRVTSQCRGTSGSRRVPTDVLRARRQRPPQRHGSVLRLDCRGFEAGCPLFPSSPVRDSRGEGLADKAAAGTFGTHLERVAGKIPDDCFRIADELNRARNGLFHWRRDRLDPQPSYRGQDVTSPSGFQACMDDVLTFIQTVPWRNP
jgi:hypothetical protein